MDLFHSPIQPSFSGIEKTTKLLIFSSKALSKCEKRSITTRDETILFDVEREYGSDISSFY